MKRWRLATLATLVVVGFWIVAAPSVVNATTGRPLRDAALELTAGYVLLSPLSRSLDALTLLSIAQHVAVFVSIVCIAAAVSFAVSRRHGKDRAVRHALWSGATAGGVLLLLNLASLVLPRPMASLAVSNPRVLRVDFHSHTNASHDTRDGFTPEKNREWHRRGGFDVAYVSDHRAYSGAALGKARNPLRAGDGTVLLSALEARYHGLFTVIPGITAVDSGLIDRRKHLQPGLFRSGREPLSIAVLPGPLSDIEPIARDEPPRFVAIELVNAAPKALGQRDREEAQIRLLSASLGLAMVAGSNNHGWGRTVPGWNLIEINGWRSLPPDSVGVLIEEQLRRLNPGTVRIAERVRPHTHGMTLPLTLPATLAQVLQGLTALERLVWIVWIWIITAVVFVVRPSRRRAA